MIKKQNPKKQQTPGFGVQACNPNIQEAESGRRIEVLGQPCLHNKSQDSQDDRENVSISKNKLKQDTHHETNKTCGHNHVVFGESTIDGYTGGKLQFWISPVNVTYVESH